MTTSQQHQKGMMGRDSIDGGMLFLLKKGNHIFHMKGCKIPLDIYFISENKITEIFKDCQICEENCQHYESYGNMVLETESNKYDFKINDIVKIINH